MHVHTQANRRTSKQKNVQQTLWDDVTATHLANSEFADSTFQAFHDLGIFSVRDEGGKAVSHILGVEGDAVLRCMTKSAQVPREQGHFT